MIDVEAPTTESGTLSAGQELSRCGIHQQRWHQAPAAPHNSFICKPQQSPGTEAQMEQGLYSSSWYLQPEQRM